LPDRHPCSLFKLGQTPHWRKGDPNRQSLSRELQDKPSIAVLPFINMSGDPEREYFADGLVEITPEELRLKQVGHVIIDTSQDRPWSQYFCCMVAANRDFVQRHPIATKHALRAILKAADICAADPQSAARFLSDKLYEPRFQIGLSVMQRLPYNRWREDDPEDTLRFHALRLHEVGLIQTSPQKLIAEHTDWRFLDELKRELKT
jgi:ABC-type nitrate/sulfonate/bicarbonate transport system substrate-binding protein